MKLKSWNGNAINDGSNYEAYWGQFAPHGLPAAEAVALARAGQWPRLARVNRPGRNLKFFVVIRSGGSSAELTGWFDYEDETAKQLIVEDFAGGNDRYVMAICEECQEVPFRAGLVYQISVKIHGDVRFRETTAATDTEAVTASGQTWNVTNNGKDDAYPIIKVKPTSAKSSGFTKRRQIFVRWRVSSAYANYPIDICNDSFDTAAEISAGDMQNDGDDLRVRLDGVEIDRWLDGINTTTTKVWCNLDFQPAIEGSLGTAIAASGSIDFIDFSAMTLGDFANLPYSGVVVINSEAFSYTSRNVQTKKLEGITRAVKGTALASHSAGTTIWWLQHDLVLLYGDSSLSAPSVDDDYKPIFDISASTNLVWDYGNFGDNDGLRTGAWQFINSTNSSQKYTGNQNTDADPWSEIGIANNILGNGLSYARWELYNPCGITNADFQGGEKRAETNLSKWSASIRSRRPGDEVPGFENLIPPPSTLSAWEAWSLNEALDLGSVAVSLQLQRGQGVPAFEDQMIECTRVVLTLYSISIPTATIGDEQAVYPLECTITNNTTGEAITLSYGMVLNQQLEVDTDERTVTYLADGTNQFQALTLVGGPRKDWLKLAPGVNQLRYDEADLVGVTVELEWEERHRQ